MKWLRIVLAGAALAGAASNASATGTGTSMFALQLGNSTADVIQPISNGYITSITLPELHAQAQYWYQFADDYAFTLTGGIGFFTETDKPGNTSTPGSAEQKTTVSSFYVRAGGDRMMKIAERMIVYFGPGIEFWNGGYKYEAGTVTEEPEKTTRISANGRIGGTMLLSQSFGLTGHIGHRWGIASAEQDGAKASWMPSGFEGAGGIVFLFGGE